MIQLNKKQSIIASFIVLHIVFFANLYYLLAFGVKTNAEVHSKFGTSEESKSKDISFIYNSKTYEFSTSLDANVQRTVPIIFSPNNPENFIPLTFKNMLLGRVTMSILFAFGLILLIQVTFRPFVVFTIRIKPFFIGFEEKKWNNSSEITLNKLIDFTPIKTLPFVYYDFKHRFSTHFEGLYQSILKHHFSIGNIKMVSIKTISPRDNTKTISKSILHLTKPISEIENLTLMEQSVLSLMENEQFSTPEFQLKMQQTFGKEYDKFNIEMMNTYLSSISKENLNRLQEINQILFFIETYPTQLIEFKPNELHQIIHILGDNIQFLNQQTLKLITKSNLNPESIDLAERNLNALLKTGFNKV